MKFLLKSLIIKFFYLLLIFMFLNENNPAQSSATPVAQIKKIIQDVTQRESESENWEKAINGENLNAGHQVKTGAKSLAVIYFTDQSSSLLRVRENSIANIYGKETDKVILRSCFAAKTMFFHTIARLDTPAFLVQHTDSFSEIDIMF